MKKAFKIICSKLMEYHYNIFCIFLTIFIFLSIIHSSELLDVLNEYLNFNAWQVANQLQWYLTLFAILCVCSRKSTMLKKVVFISFFIVFWISYQRSQTLNFLTAVAFIFFVDKKDIRIPIKAMGIGVFLGIIVVLGAVALGIIPNNVRGILRIRYYLGFRSPIFLSGHLLNFAYIYLYLNKNKLTIFKVLFLIIPASLVYFLTDGRMSFVALMLATTTSYIFTNYFKNKELLTKCLVKSIKSIYLVSLGVSIFVAINFLNFSFLQRFDDFTTGRLSWFSIYWQNYSPTIFGQTITRVSSATARRSGVEAMILDNAFLSMVLENGILVLVIFTASLFLLLKYLKKEKDVVSLIIWLVMVLTFNIGNNSLFFTRNPLLFQFALFFQINIDTNKYFSKWKEVKYRTYESEINPITQ